MRTKKGQAGLSNLFQAVLLLVMVVIMVGLGTIVLSQMGKVSDLTNSSMYGFSNYSLNVLNNGTNAIASVSTTWIAIIVIVVVVGLIISILLGAFAFKKQ